MFKEVTAVEHNTEVNPFDIVLSLKKRNKIKVKVFEHEGKMKLPTKVLTSEALLHNIRIPLRTVTEPSSQTSDRNVQVFVLCHIWTPAR